MGDHRAHMETRLEGSSMLEEAALEGRSRGITC
jgi:hypothetical protein